MQKGRLRPPFLFYPPGMDEDYPIFSRGSTGPVM